MTLRRLLAGLAAAAALSVALPGHAAAQQPPTPPPSPTTLPPATPPPATPAPATAADADDGPDARPGESGNLLGFEEYGTYPLSRYTIGCDEGAWNHLSRKAWCFAQQMPFEGSKLLIGLSASMITWAMNFELAEGLNSAAGSMAATYETRLVGGLQLRHLAWMLTCFWVGWLVMRARTAQALGELATTCVVAALGSFLIANPAGYLNGAASFVRSTNDAVLNALAGEDPPAGGVAADVGAQLHQSFVAEPYDVINWGGSLDATPGCAAARDEILATGPYGSGSDRPREIMSAAGCNDQSDFNHDPGGDRTVASIACFCAALLVLVLMCLLAATVLAAQLMLVVLWAVSPLAIVAGIAPGGTRQVLWRWLGANATVYLVNLACVLTLGFVTTMTTQVLDMTDDVSIVKRLGLIDLVVVAGLVFRKQLTHAAHAAGARAAANLARVVPAQAGTSPMRPAATGGVSGYAVGRHLNEAVAEVPGGRRAQYVVEHRMPYHARRAARTTASWARHPFGGRRDLATFPTMTARTRRHATAGTWSPRRPRRGRRG